MEVLMDNGLYRHLKFTNNGSSVYRFDIHTWPGYLAVSGDMGSWMFSRITDMFEFFIIDERDFNHKHVINPGYWGEKLTAMDGHHDNSYMTFDQDLFEENVKNEYDQWIEGNDIDPKSNYAETLWEALQEEVIGASYDGEIRGMDAAMSFKFKDDDWRLNRKVETDEPLGYGTFNMQDFWDYSNRDYTYHYIWICYAIVWGITQYNKFKEAE